ncbi:MAG: pyruvate kinase [Spirochaetales bacterium]|uniref:Pyruvate kinase n=1 Tax=Candidatus Thalassospirochaeta sargassi TaxID=3119039 RepID=A0AAJ1ICQ6_9SPIO|nr:pyruvate kinase [Spirochaetales bacterium]
MKRQTDFAKTKIIGTIGPATNTPEMIADLIKSGLDVARLNFSHGSHEEHAENIRTIREGAGIADSPVAILADLCGPKIRLGLVEKPFEIEAGESVVISTDPENYTGKLKLIPTEYAHLAEDVKSGDRILMDDGLLQVSVRETSGSDVICDVIDGGLVKSRKGMNLPNVDVSESAITAKDRKDLDFIVTQDIDFIALSFVRSRDDIRELRWLLKEREKSLPIIAKIEKPEAINDIDAIIRETDMIMVARGDLGVEMPPQDVPNLQKMIIRKCIEYNKPVITATQMLESMINNPRPTRAEASDVANAVYDGTDAVMLSGETSVGEYPLAAVRTMEQIVRSSERHALSDEFVKVRRSREKMTDEENICRSACIMAQEAGARAIIAITRSGKTARLLSKYRSDVPILAFSQNDRTIRELNIVWGVQGESIDEVGETDATLKSAKEAALRLGYLNSGDKVVYTTGIPLLNSKAANMVKIDTA